LIKKTVTYENFNDETVTEDHFFHLSKAEIVEMELSMEGGLSKHLERVVKSEDGGEIMRTFKTLLLDSYGRKSDDGRSFVKNPQIREEFASSEAYSVIFMELATNADAAAEFVNGIVPKGLEEEVEKFRANQDKPDTPRARPEPVGIRGGGEPQELGVKAAVPEQGPPTPQVEQRILTRAEVEEMPSEELQRLLSSGEARIGSTEG
jgi:hypothetical protein